LPEKWKLKLLRPASNYLKRLPNTEVLRIIDAFLLSFCFFCALLIKGE